MAHKFQHGDKVSRKPGLVFSNNQTIATVDYVQLPDTPGDPVRVYFLETGTWLPPDRLILVERSDASFDFLQPGKVCLYNDATLGLIPTKIIAHHPERPTVWHEAVEGEFGDGTSHSVDDFSFFRAPYTDAELAEINAEEARKAEINRIENRLIELIGSSASYLAERIYEEFVAPSDDL